MSKPSFPSQLLPLILLASPTHLPPSHAISALHGAPSTILQWFLVPFNVSFGFQKPLHASALNEGEFPATANINSGYVFRVENEATVYFLQQVGVTGCLVHLNVAAPEDSKEDVFSVKWVSISLALPMIVLLATIASDSGMKNYLRAIDFDLSSQTHKSLLSWSVISDLAAIWLIFISRLFQNLLLFLRTRASWHGVSEPGIRGSLLVLLSRDRWVRLDGMVDDLKAVTSGSWLSPETPFQSALSQLGCLMVWLAVILLCGCSLGLQLFVVLLFCCGHVVACVGTSSGSIKRLGIKLKGRRILVDERQGQNGVKAYKRRLDMAEELIEETGRRDWAEKLGMVNKQDSVVSKTVDEHVTM